jgi:hypothetical protein
MVVRIYPGTFIGFAATFLHRRFFGKHKCPRRLWRIFPDSRDASQWARRSSSDTGTSEKRRCGCGAYFLAGDFCRRRPAPGVMHGRHLGNQHATYYVATPLHNPLKLRIDPCSCLQPVDE